MSKQTEDSILSDFGFSNTFKFVYNVFFKKHIEIVVFLNDFKEYLITAQNNKKFCLTLNLNLIEIFYEKLLKFKESFNRIFQKKNKRFFYFNANGNILKQKKKRSFSFTFDNYSINEIPVFFFIE